jgi:glycosyltransferase involved in cell wall biosynthesis
MAVVVAPLRFGTGLKIKCIEALAYGKALVTTSSGAEGLAHGGGDHLCIADTAEAFANAVADLLVNVERRGQLEHNALGFARRWQDQQMQAVRKLYQPLQVAGL